MTGPLRPAEVGRETTHRRHARPMRHRPFSVGSIDRRASLEDLERASADAFVIDEGTDLLEVRWRQVLDLQNS